VEKSSELGHAGFLTKLISENDGFRFKSRGPIC